MKTYVTLLFCLFISLNSIYGQRIDSIQYEYGYLYFHEYGSRDAVPLILLTGGPGNEYVQLEELAKILSQRYWCIIPEQRGTGRSTPDVLDSTTVSLAALTNDIKRLLVHHNLGQASILGHSWGGMLAMNFAVTYPTNVKKVVLVGPGAISNVAESDAIFSANKKNTYSQDELIRLNHLNKLHSESDMGSQAIEERKKLIRLAYIYANPIPDSIFHKIDAKNNGVTMELLWTELTRSFDLTESIKRYKGRIHIISGRQDPLGYVSYELKILQPLIDLNWIEKCGHFPMYEKPVEFFDILYKILE